VSVDDRIINEIISFLGLFEDCCLIVINVKCEV
jgi:hypothetical protein